MKFFILFPVLVWASSSADGTLFNNTNFPGNDIQRVLSPSVKCCQLYCTGYPQCTVFTYVPAPSFTCYLKHSTVPPVSAPLSNAVSGYPLTTVGSSSDSCSKTLYKDIDFLGSDIKIILRDSPGACQNACTTYPDCQFFTYITPNYTPAPFMRTFCFMKYTQNMPSPPVINILGGVVSGYSQKDCYEYNTCDFECGGLLIPNVDFRGNDFAQVLAPDAERCQLICTQNPHCQFFTFLTTDWTADNRRFFCYLKSSTSMPGSNGLSNVVSGFSLRYFGINKICSPHVFKDLDFPGNDRKMVKVGSFFQCEELCSQDPFCQFYTYVTEDYVNKDQQKNCYLKNIFTFPTPPIINDLKDVVSGFPNKYSPNFAG